MVIGSEAERLASEASHQGADHSDRTGLEMPLLLRRHLASLSVQRWAELLHISVRTYGIVVKVTINRLLQNHPRSFTNRRSGVGCCSRPCQWTLLHDSADMLTASHSVSDLGRQLG